MHARITHLSFNLFGFLLESPLTIRECSGIKREINLGTCSGIHNPGYCGLCSMRDRPSVTKQFDQMRYSKFWKLVSIFL